MLTASRPRKSFGFTLLELIFTLFAILFVIALLTPACGCGITKRDKVAEGLGLLTGLKTPAEEWFLKYKRFPSVASLGGKTGGRYTTNIQLEDKFSYSARFLDPKITGKLVLSYNPENGRWDCSKSTNIPEKDLPSNCQLE